MHGSELLALYAFQAPDALAVIDPDNDDGIAYKFIMEEWPGLFGKDKPLLETSERWCVYICSRKRGVG